MPEFNKYEWIINNRNVFELPEIENIPLSTIGYEVLNQIESKNINSVSEFLNYDIDIKKEIRFTDGISINKIFNEYLKLNNNPLDVDEFPVFLIHQLQTLWLFKKYVKNDHNPFIIARIYKEQYEKNKSIYLNSNIDTDQTDFINSELSKCEAIILELKKPIYNNNGLGNIENEPTDFKKRLLFSIDKRKKFLKNILNSLETKMPINEELPPQQTDVQKPELTETELSEKISKHFGFFKGNCPRKHKQILKDEDFDRLIEWTNYYFENEFKVPEISEPITVVNTNKTYVQLAFKYLFKELHKANTYPASLFDFYKSAFTPYSEDKKEVLDKVKNNSVVKKLMKIDY